MRLGYRIRIRMGLCRWIHYDVACMSVLDERTSVLMPRFRKISRLRIVFLAFSYHDYISCTWLLYTVVFANDLVEFFIFFAKPRNSLCFIKRIHRQGRGSNVVKRVRSPPPFSLCDFFKFSCPIRISDYIWFVYLSLWDSLFVSVLEHSRTATLLGQIA